MTLQPQKIGDKGQRYEVRALMKSGKEQAIAWLEYRLSADKFASAYCTLAEEESCPIASAWVVDRQPKAGPDELPRELIGQILQDRLSRVLLGAVVGPEMIQTASAICQQFAADFPKFPPLEVVQTGRVELQIFEKFESLSEAQAAKGNVISSLKLTEADRQALDKSFDEIYKRFHA